MEAPAHITDTNTHQQHFLRAQHGTGEDKEAACSGTCPSGERDAQNTSHTPHLRAVASPSRGPDPGRALPQGTNARSCQLHGSPFGADALFPRRPRFAGGGARACNVSYPLYTCVRTGGGARHAAQGTWGAGNTGWGCKAPPQGGGATQHQG